MMSYIIQRMPVRDAMYFPCLSVFVWTGENDSNKLRVDAFFSKTEEKISVLKNIRIRRRGLRIFNLRDSVLQ